MKAALVLGLLFIFVIAGVANAAATCASGPFIKACNACTFDANGKMNEACWKSYESEGQTCLATSYPAMALKYQFSGCKQLDTCISRLSSCKEAQKSGSDAKDCNNPSMINCFKIADNCAEAASKVCADGETEEEAGFNNESAGGPIKEIKNTTNTTKNTTNTTKTVDEYEPATLDDVVDFICGGPAFVMLLAFGMLIVRKE